MDFVVVDGVFVGSDSEIAGSLTLLPSGEEPATGLCLSNFLNSALSHYDAPTTISNLLIVILEKWVVKAEKVIRYPHHIKTLVHWLKCSLTRWQSKAAQGSQEREERTR